MSRLKELFSGEDRAVSPVIGVILMVAITVILAAVIASFVLGLGDSAAEPAPNPTISTSESGDVLTIDVTGGDDFNAGDATIQGEVANESFEFSLDAANANLEEVTAGDTIEFNASNEAVEINDNVIESDEKEDEWAPDDDLEEWDVEIVWNPADADSEIIFSDSS